MNEDLKHCPPKFIILITNPFNLILDSGIFPEQWSLGIIKPIYKNSVDSNRPSNYRGITIFSCLRKLFSNLLNNRLTRFVDENQLIGPALASFMPGFSIIDYFFTLKTLIDLHLSKRGQLYCYFVDNSKAFDTVSRAALWSKLLNSNVCGKIFNIIVNMYKSAKS